MERRDALKNLDLNWRNHNVFNSSWFITKLFGKSNLSWNLEIFDSQEVELITKTLEVILPKQRISQVLLN